MLMRSEHGFTLLETLTAVLVITVCLSFIVPAYIKIIQERESLKQEEEALSVLNQSLYHWIQNEKDQPSIISQSGVQFHLVWQLLGEGHIQICLDWSPPNKRSQRLCGEAVHFR